MVILGKNIGLELIPNGLGWIIGGIIHCHEQCSIFSFVLTHNQVIEFENLVLTCAPPLRTLDHVVYSLCITGRNKVKSVDDSNIEIYRPVAMVGK